MVIESPLVPSNDFIANLTAKITSLANSLSTSVVDKLLNPTGSPGYINKRKIELRNKWTDASNNYKTAPFQLSLAEKNYYEYNDGKPNGADIYEATIFDRFANNAEDLKKNSIEKQQEFMTDISQTLKQYQGVNLTSIRTTQLLKVRQDENADLKKKLEMYDRILQTSERKVVYEINDTTGLHTWRRVMLFLYYAAIVCYIIFGNFIPDKLYLNKTVWLIIVIASLVPIILNLIIKWIFVIGSVLAYWFKERPYKDVYADL